MSSLDTRHPSEDDLLRYADGELPAKQAASVRAHLEACWQCRAEHEEIQKIVGDCVRFRKAALESYLPSPPEPWRDIRRQFAEVDSRLGSRLFWARIGELLLAPVRRPGRFAQAGIAIAVLLAVVYQLTQAPRVEAAELLRKAVVASDARKPLARRLRVRHQGREFTRTVGMTGAQPVAAAAKQEAQQVEALFTGAHYSWDDPLSPRAYLNWYEQLADKQGEVTTLGGASVIRTTTQSGDLLEATLKLRQADMVAIEGTFHFRNDEVISVSQLEEVPPGVVASTPVAEVRPPVLPERVAPSIGASPAPVPAIVPPASAGDELHVIAALHRVGADLGDPIEVVRGGGGEIRVTGVGIDSVRRQEIARAMDTLPRVVTDFQEIPAAPRDAVATRALVKRPALNEDVRQVQAKLEQYLGGRPAFERYSDELVASSDTMMAHVHALRRLAERFPEPVEAGLSAEDQTTLVRIQSEHMQAIRQENADLQTLGSALAKSGAVPAGTLAMTAPVGSWQQQAASLFQAAQRVERLIAMMLGGASAEGESHSIAGELDAALRRLQAQMH